MKVYKTKLEAALEYAAKNIPVFPIWPKGNRKKPACSWGTEQSKDAEQIIKWWTENPDFEIGLVTGEKSGIVVVDFDTTEAWDLINKLGLPIGPVVKTGKGYHVYCKYETGIRNFQKRSDLPGIDLRGEGGYVVAPPSVHESGTVYTWVDGKSIDDFDVLPPVPEWILARNKGDKQPISELLEGVTEGQRNIALTRLVGHWLQEQIPYQQIVKNALYWNQKNKPPEENIGMVMATINSICKRDNSIVVADEWEDPILFDGINSPEISAELLPSWLGGYAKAVSQSTQSPEALAVMMGLSTVATCVQKRFEVCPFGDDYKETLSLWTVTVLPPSERKTPVVSAMTSPLMNWEIEQATLLEEQIIETNAMIAIDEKRITKLEKSAADTDDATDRTQLIQQIREIRASMPANVFPPKLWTGDTTVERLQELLVENDERMSVVADEGGIFEIMAGLYNDGKVNIDVFLQGYSGMQVRVERKTRSVTLRRPAVSFGLTVQPSVIESFSHGSKKAFKGKGALARFLFCLPKSMLGRRIIDQRIQVPDAIKIRYEEGIRRLLDIEKQVDEFGVEVPRLLRLAPEALGLWIKFSQQVESTLGPDGELATLNDWGGKLAGTCLRIAGLTHLAEHGPDNLVISSETIKSSITICTLLKEHAKAAYGMIGADAGINGAKKIFEWMKRRNFEGFTKTQCHSALHSIFSAAEEFDKSMKILIGRYIIRKMDIPTAGRPAQTFICNPTLKTGSVLS